MKLNPINPVLPLSRQGAEQRHTPGESGIGDTFSNLLDAVNRQQLASDQYSAACDSEQKTLSLDLSSMHLTCENGAKVHFA